MPGETDSPLRPDRTRAVRRCAEARRTGAAGARQPASWQRKRPEGVIGPASIAKRGELAKSVLKDAFGALLVGGEILDRQPVDPDAVPGEKDALVSQRRCLGPDLVHTDTQLALGQRHRVDHEPIWTDQT